MTLCREFQSAIYGVPFLFVSAQLPSGQEYLAALINYVSGLSAPPPHRRQPCLLHVLPRRAATHSYTGNRDYHQSDKAVVTIMFGATGRNCEIKYLSGSFSVSNNPIAASRVNLNTSQNVREAACIGLACGGPRLSSSTSAA